MNNSLESPRLRFAFDALNGTWKLEDRSGRAPILEAARLAVAYRVSGARQQALGPGTAWKQVGAEPRISPHGPGPGLDLAARGIGGLAFQLSFVLLENHPGLLWRVRVKNYGSQPVLVDSLTLFHVRLRQNEARARAGIPGVGSPTERFFSNGWQSWSYAGVYRPGGHFKHTRLGPLRTPTDAPPGSRIPRRSGSFTSEMFGVWGDFVQGWGWLAGFLSQREHFGSLEAGLRPGHAELRLWAHGDGARLDPGALMSTDWACLQILDLQAPAPLDPYLDLVAAEHGLASPSSAPSSPTGWCSWYQFSSPDYMGTVSAAAVRENLHALVERRSQLPLQVLQIDDGFQSQVGDWFTFSPAFPGGVAPLAQEIRQAGLTPGLWLAPFIVHPRARLAAQHPDWLLRDRRGRPANAGYLWGAFAQALDLTHPEALDYACQVVDTAAHAWGFPYLKLDFLYAAALAGAPRDPTRTRAQVLRMGLEALRAAAGPETTLLGCGCPLGPAIGLVDAMRIGADTASRWRPAFNGLQALFASEPNLPAAGNACHNALTRAPFHHRWWTNDPDCLLLREDTHLTLAEIQSLAAVIALTGGSFLLSDDLPRLPPARRRIAEALLPLIDRRPQVLDLFHSPDPRLLRLDLSGPIGNWSLLAMFNWEDSPQEMELGYEMFRLPAQEPYWGREFWQGRVFRLLPGQSPWRQSLPAHGGLLVAVRPQAEPAEPQYLGSDLHISQGLEVRAWESSSQGLALALERPGRAEGCLDLALPALPLESLLNDQPLPYKDLGGGVYRFAVEFVEQAILRVNYLSS